MLDVAGVGGAPVGRCP